ncbi:type II toxin-antitoxin system HicB family antitoxin [Nostoc sp. FACHB-152]|uniref:type II toxin-antitoxin system HicB family antitoxin n=1 Tax=unclassified Nostoc TaxID=2593658 RepID=UPI00168442B7|nr:MULTISPECIES: type II toxin-antitoxin system HicB family antitoxin [unclassified Nostoc]MBD2445713.1 type II toxin-antitoxin system HicB family antitoxin [Nostoc sp. FACHB-152]MBD2466827.1 type II toxin-antitoxin system HicB family antitoxin [Nostoc sp. FACHB-145]
MNYRYSMIIQWSDEDKCYLVHLPEFPWQQYHTHGATYAEAAKHGQEVIESLIEWYQEQGKLLPEAIALPEKPLKVA